MRQDIHAETPLFKRDEVSNNNNLYGFEMMMEHADQNFLEALRSSALFHAENAPEKQNKRAFAVFVDDAVKAACTHHFSALNYLAALMLTDQKSAQRYDLYEEVSHLVKNLREYHQRHVSLLTVVAKNLRNTYSDAIQAYACERLQNFTLLNDECKQRQRIGGDASLALEMIARDINRHFKWKAKPEFINHLTKVLSIFNNKFDDLYAMVISNHIVSFLKTQLDGLLQIRAPMLPDTRKKYEEYRDLIQQVLDKNANPQEIYQDFATDVELPSIGNF